MERVINLTHFKYYTLFLPNYIFTMKFARLTSWSNYTITTRVKWIYYAHFCTLKHSSPSLWVLQIVMISWNLQAEPWPKILRSKVESLETKLLLRICTRKCAIDAFFSQLLLKKDCYWLRTGLVGARFGRCEVNSQAFEGWHHANTGRRFYIDTMEFSLVCSYGDFLFLSLLKIWDFLSSAELFREFNIGNFLPHLYCIMKVSFRSIFPIKRE